MVTIIDSGYLIHYKFYSCLTWLSFQEDVTEDEKEYPLTHEGYKKTFENSIRKIFKYEIKKSEKIFYAMESRNNWRKKMYPQYKATRKKKKSNCIGECFLIAENIIKTEFPNVVLLHEDSMEADDLIAKKYYELMNTDVAVKIMTSDSDFFQLKENSEDNSILLVNIKNKENKNKTDLYGEQYLIYKSIHGDTADNIFPIVRGYGSTKKKEKFYNMIINNETNEFEEEINDKYKLNRSLIDLRKYKSA